MFLVSCFTSPFIIYLFIFLGGLARTCEIFSCSLALSSTSILNDPIYHNVSSSASKHVSTFIVSASSDSLSEWLKQCKLKYNCIIMGLEQSCRSIPLNEFSFQSYLHSPIIL